MKLIIKINKETISFEIGDLFADCYFSPFITEIVSIEEFDKNFGGYIVFTYYDRDGNQGEDYLCIADIFLELGLDHEVQTLNDLLKHDIELEVINYRESAPTTQHTEEYSLTEDNLAFHVDASQAPLLKLKVFDLSNPYAKAVLISPEQSQPFRIYNSTFRDERREQMLHITRKIQTNTTKNE